MSDGKVTRTTHLLEGHREQVVIGAGAESAVELVHLLQLSTTGHDRTHGSTNTRHYEFTTPP
jgi:hypothetical protein